jgi:hypothetical protein
MLITFYFGCFAYLSATIPSIINKNKDFFGAALIALPQNERNPHYD